MTYVFCTTKELRDAVVACEHHEGRIRYGPMHTWDVSRIQVFSRLFVDCNYLFACTTLEDGDDADGEILRCRPWNDISEWNTTRATHFDFMFDGCIDFNQPLRWNVTNADDMEGMFRGCKNFNQKLEWNTENVRYIHAMFEGCTSFNTPLMWNVSRVVSMSRIFEDCASFNQSFKWEIGPLTGIENMFKGCNAFDGPCCYFNEWQLENTALSSTPWFKNDARLKSQSAVEEINDLCYRKLQSFQVDIENQINDMEDAEEREDAYHSLGGDMDIYYDQFMGNHVSRAYSILKRNQLVKDTNVSKDFGCYDSEQKWGSDVIRSVDPQQSRNHKRQYSH
jgi:hypothetical protein